MTYQAACGCPPPDNQPIYAPPSYPPPAPASTPATHPRGALLLSGVVRITQKGSVIYQTVPCGPPPSYDSILQLAEACNCCQTTNERVGGSDGDLHSDAAGPAGAEGGIAGPRMRRCVSNEYVQFCHVDGRQVVVGPHANQCPVCEINRRRAQQQEEDAYVYSPVTPPPPAGVDGVDAEEDAYNFRERPQIPTYDDGPQPIDLIYNLPVDATKVALPCGMADKDRTAGENGEGQEPAKCTCECVQCLADCHGNCIYGTLDLKGCRSQSKAGKSDQEAAEPMATGDDDQRQKQILQLHQQLRKRHEQHVMEHQKLLQEQHRAFQTQLAKASGRKYPRSREQSEDLDPNDIAEEQEEEPLLPEPLKPTEYKRENVQWAHPLQEELEGVDKADWPSPKVETEKTEQTPLLQPVTEVTDPEIRQQLLQRQLLEHQWRLHQQQQQEQNSGAKDKDIDLSKDGENAYGLTVRRDDGSNQLFMLQPLQPQQAKEPIYSLHQKQQHHIEQQKKAQEQAWNAHKQQQLAGVQLPPVQTQQQPQQQQQEQVKPKEKKRSFWPFSRGDKSASSDEKMLNEARQKRHSKQLQLHQELMQHRLIFREQEQLWQQATQQQTRQPKLAGQLPPQKQNSMQAIQNQQELILKQIQAQKEKRQQLEQQQKQQLQQEQEQLQSILVQHEQQGQQLLQQHLIDSATNLEHAQQVVKPSQTGKSAQRVRFSFSDETEDKKEPSNEQALLAQHVQLQEQAPKNESTTEKVERQRKHHHKILQKQAELLEKYKREWLERKKKDNK